MKSDNQEFGPQGLGAIISPVDPRDWTLASAGASTSYPTSCEIDISWMTINNQKQIGCCVGCAVEAAMRQVLYKITGIKPEEMSFRFLYAIAKCTDGIASEGTYGATVSSVGKKYGIPLAKYCPNDTNLDHESFVYNRKLSNIPKEAWDDAATRKDLIEYYTEPATEEGLKKAILFAKEKGGAVVGIRLIGNTYWTDANGNYTWDPAKILPIRIPKSFPYGHAEMLNAYDLEPGTNRLCIRWIGSWSDGWADKGKAWEYADVWLPYFREIRVIVPKVQATDGFKYNFKTTMSRGMKGPDVVALQHVLKLEKCFPETQSFTGNYGDITFNGVMQLQEKYASEILTPAGLKRGTGTVGFYTLNWLVKNYGINNK